MNRLRFYHRSKSGSVTVEFALIFPVLLALLFGLVEVANIIEFHRKIDLVASTTGDISSELMVDQLSDYSGKDEALASTSIKKVCALLNLGMTNYYPFDARRVSSSLSYFNGDKWEWTVSLRGEQGSSIDNYILPDWFKQRYNSELNDTKEKNNKLGVLKVHVESGYNPIFLKNVFNSLNLLDKKKDYLIFLRNADNLICKDCNYKYKCS